MLARRLKYPTTLAANVTRQVVQIRYGTETFHLKQPIDLEVRSDHGHSIVAYPALEIEGYGDNDQEALESFADQFGSTWHAVALASDLELTRDARQLKKRMLKL